MLNETQNILARLAVADREHQKEAGIALLLRSVKYVCAGIVAAFLLDVIFHFNAGWRLGLLCALILSVLLLFVSGWYLAFVHRNRVEHIARFLETRDPALGSRLINLLQLTEQTRDTSLTPVTRELARQAVERYASEIREVPIENLARTGRWHHSLLRAAWVLLGFAILLALVFRITTTEIARFADPFGDHPPYSFTRLEIVQPGPAGTNVIYGSGVIVKVKVTGHRPRELYLTAFPPGHPEQATTLPMFNEHDAGFDQLLADIRSNLVLFAHTKDSVSESKRVRIGVTLTPQLRQAFVQITRPAYTGIRPVEKPYNFKDVQALAGSEVRFRLRSNRPLREGWLEITAGNQPPRRVRLKKSAENEVAGSFVAADSGLMRFSIVDVSGLPSLGDYEGALTVTHDLPPEIHIAYPQHDAFVAMDFKLPAQIEANDDYGLREIRLHRGLNGVYSAPKVYEYPGVVLDSRETAVFDFANLGIRPGDVISLFAEAVDTAPQPHLTRSQTVRLRVISVEDYNNYLREQTDISDAEAKYAALNNKLQALIEQQKQLGDAMQKLGKQLAGANAKQREALAPALDSLIAKQNELNEKLNQQAGRMEHFVREHPLYDVERDLQALLNQQAKNIRQSTRDNDAAAREVAQQSSPPGGPRQLSPEMLAALKKASDEQVARLGGVHQETEDRIVKKLAEMDQMQRLIEDFNLFEALFHVQQDVTLQAQAYNRPGLLIREDQLALNDLAATEHGVRDSLALLPGKLRTDAAAAEKLFPKAARSGRDLADQITDHRLEPLARQATGRMLEGDGEQSYQVADRLRREMEKLFSECRGGNCPSGNELDAYLRLQRMNPGNNFAQMSLSRKFGFGQGRGRAGGSGEGMMGTSGFVVVDGTTMKVMGNESSALHGNAAARQSSRFGQGAGALATGEKGQPGEPDVMKGLNPINRRSAAVSSEADIEQYNQIVDSYFKAITTRKENTSQ